MGLSLDSFTHFKPIVITNFMTEQCFSNDNWASLDQTLWNFAQKNDKILRGVESVEEQVAIIEKISVDEQIKTLKDTIQNFTKYRRQLRKLTQHYEQADILSIYKTVKKTAHGKRELLLFNRNFLMARRIEILSSEGSVCVAIGAGHLAGKKGVLSLLKKQGFIVKMAN
ncbi:MAG: TraB/GumN family protein [Saprospiraceae bacterium]|nr:TraB/GumN family protein [Saprospiraceae bacterium]